VRRPTSHAFRDFDAAHVRCFERKPCNFLPVRRRRQVDRTSGHWGKVTNRNLASENNRGRECSPRPAPFMIVAPPRDAWVLIVTKCYTFEDCPRSDTRR
jgi:hypothetical protein